MARTSSNILHRDSLQRVKSNQNLQNSQIYLQSKKLQKRTALDVFLQQTDQNRNICLGT